MIEMEEWNVGEIQLKVIVRSDIILFVLVSVFHQSIIPLSPM